MQSLLGKITSIVKKDDEADLLRVSFKPVCTMPQRNAVPEWLKDQTIEVERRVPDQRELGGPGDSIVLAPDEARNWLYPLSVSPAIAYGKMPEKLTVRLAWWKDENPPNWTVRANGRQVTGKFEKAEAGFAVTMETSDFYDSPPSLPVDFEITCDKLKAGVSVLLEREPHSRKITLPEGVFNRLDSPWHSVDVIAGSHAGGIVRLVEKGRGLDHFHTPENAISQPFEFAGHLDRMYRGWDRSSWSPLDETAMTSVSAKREGGATRLTLEGMIDEGQNVRSSVAYTLMDDMPLIVLRRDYYFGAAKKKDEPKDKPEKPKEIVDDLNSIALSFRGAWVADRAPSQGSRLHYSDEDGVTTVRCATIDERVRVRMGTVYGGWFVMEHPLRKEYTMYLFDPESRPGFRLRLEAYPVSLESVWPTQIVKPGDGIGYTLGICAGELCGTAPGAAWLACRTALPTGGVRCAVIARILNPASPLSAHFTLGDRQHDAVLEKVLVPGLGPAAYAVADVPDGRIGDEFDVVAAGIASRRLT